MIQSTTLQIRLIALLAFTSRSQEAPWLGRALVGIETGPTGAQCGSDVADTGYVARFNGRDCIQRAVVAYCDYMVDQGFGSPYGCWFERELERYFKQTWPGTSVDFNYHGNPPFSFEVGQRPVQHGVAGDFITGETGQWAFSALGSASMRRFTVQRPSTGVSRW